MLLTFFDMSARTHYLNARQTLRKLLEWRVVPVINENDTTTTDEISFGNNDFLAAQVAILLGAELLLLLTDAGGRVHRRPARSTAAPSWSPRSTSSTSSRRSRSATRTSPLGSGGMRSKVVAAEMATAAGIPTVIASGLEPGTILRGAGGRARSARGSRRARAATRASSCGSSTPSRRAGRVLVDAGAARALREGGTSLLPVGVVEVGGEFDAGDAVEVAHDGEAVGKGISQLLGRRAAAACAGCKSAAVRELLPRASEEAVHRDYFVLA